MTLTNSVTLIQAAELGTHDVSRYSTLGSCRPSTPPVAS